MNVLLGRLLASVFLVSTFAAPSGQIAHYRHHGAALLNDDLVTPGVVRTIDRDAICNGGSTKQFRNTTEAMKKQVYSWYGVDKHKMLTGDEGMKGKAPLYEIDHLISLELGGADDVKNLWPQPYYEHPGAHEKDAVENLLHKKICSEEISPVDAQRLIATDWYQVYIDEHLAPASNTGTESEAPAGISRAE